MFEYFSGADTAELARRAVSHGPSAVFVASPPKVDDLTVLADQMLATARKHALDAPTDLADFAIDAFDCEALLDRVPRPMSRGERQLCGLLIAFARPFDALFIVDPVAGLDARRRRALMDIFHNLAEDRLIVSTTRLDPI